jgi:hypothetical protein
LKEIEAERQRKVEEETERKRRKKEEKLRLKKEEEEKEKEANKLVNKMKRFLLGDGKVEPPLLVMAILMYHKVGCFVCELTPCSI